MNTRVSILSYTEADPKNREETSSSAHLTHGEEHGDDEDSNDWLFRSFVLDLSATLSEERADFLDGMISGEVDPMYFYMGREATEKYLAKMLSANDYTIYKDSLDLLKSSREKVAEKILAASTACNKQLRIVSLGVGNGQKEICLLDVLLDRIPYLEHIAIDISADMLKEGLRNIRNVFADAFRDRKIKTFATVGNFSKIDKYFSERYFSEKSDKINVFLLLGNTIGNFDEIELLYKIKDAMNSGDFILIDNQLKDEGPPTPEQIKILEKAYGSRQEKENVYAVVKRANILPEYGEVKTFVQNFVNGMHLVNDDCIVVKLCFIFKNDRDRRVTVQNKPHRYRRGHEIQVYASKRYTKKALVRIIKDVVGLEIVDDYSNDYYGMLLCRKRI